MPRAPAPDRAPPMAENNRLYAYVINPALDMPLQAAPLDRAWMDAWHDRAPYRCLPLVIANQAGWVILNSTDFTVTWDGRAHQNALRLEFGAPPPPPPPPAASPFGGVVDVSAFYQPPPTQPRPQAVPHITSLFGGGVLTFNVPYLFRTPPGIN